MGTPDLLNGMRGRITRHVIAQITGGAWKPGDRIPSEQELTSQFGVSRMTVHHALRDLATRGFLVRRAGSGTYVAGPSAYVTEYRHLDIIAEIEQRDGRHRAEVLCREIRPSTDEEAAAFAVPVGTELFHAQVLHLENEDPVELENRLIAPAFLPDAMAIDLSRQTLFSRLMLIRPYREGSETVRAVAGTPEQCARLRVPPGTPLLQVERKTWSAEGVVTIAHMVRAGNSAALNGRIRSVGSESDR